MRNTILLAVFAALLQAAPQTPVAPPQSPQPRTVQPPVTFRVEVNYVEIDATVEDAQGNFVKNLTRDDFQIVEDGKPQNLTAFSMVDIPIERPDPPLYSNTAIPPDVVTNRTPFEGRVWVLVLDDLNTRFNRTARSRAAARQFVERYVGANDIIAVVNSSGYGKATQDFTSSRALALKAIDGAMGNKAESATSAALQDYYQNRDTGMTGNANASFNELQRWNNARNSIRTLKNIADYMAGMRGRRKAVVYFSEGLNYNIVDTINNSHATDVRNEVQDLIAAATRGNVSFYSVDPRGVTTGMEDAIEIGAMPADGSISSTALMEEMRIEHDSLRVIADQTGGFPVLNQNDFRNAFSRILEESSSYYVLGYYPTNEKSDGRFRNVQVKVLKPGLRVRYRKGYVAPKPTKSSTKKVDDAPRTSPELRDALDSPIAISGLTLNAFAAPFKGTGDKVSVALTIEVDGRSLTFTQNPQGQFTDDLEISLFAADGNGKIKDGVHDVFNLAFKPQTHDLVRQSAFRIVRRIEVPPGKYQLRIGARESGSGNIGTVVTELDAPDFAKASTSMSGIVIASASGSRLLTANPDKNPASEFKDVLPAPPSAVREFPRGDTLSVFAEVYDTAGRTPHTVDITATILADDGKVVTTKADARKSEELQGASGGYGYATEFPLSNLAPGRYVLRLTAKSRLDKGDGITREVEFRVR
jgi:VWFA-related protein